MRVFNNILLFVAVSLVALILAAASFSSATSTIPLDFDASDIPRRYLVRDQQTGEYSFAFTNNTIGKVPVAAFRWGGDDMQMVTGWFYLQITSRSSTMESAIKTAQKQLHDIAVNPKMSKMQKLEARRKVTPNEAALSVEGLKRFVTVPDMFSAQVLGGENFFNAGIIEGYLLAQQGKATAPQYSSGKTTYPACQTKWLADHFAYLKQQYQTAAQGGFPVSQDQAYWESMARIWNQLEGLAVGFNKFGGANYTAQDIYLANMASDAMDMYCKETTGTYIHSDNHVTPIKKSSINRFKKEMKVKGSDGLPGGPLHCSALIRPTSEGLFSSHITWSGWDSQFAQRVYKTYSLGSTNTVSFSGRMDFTVSSVDDFYQVYGYGSDSGRILNVWETTMEILNLTLYKASVPTLCAEFSRVQTANYLAATPKEWSENFAYKNGGEYCNSYIAVAFDQYSPYNQQQGGQNPGFFYLSEQLPGYVETRDYTPYLNKNGFFGSYNIPVFKTTYELSGNEQAFLTEGNFFSYTEYARAKIFARNHTYIEGPDALAAMMKMMRYNNWQYDNLSDIAVEWNTGCEGATNNKCSPTRSSMFSIASRGDLMTVYPTNEEMIAHYGTSVKWGLTVQPCFGAVDAKIAQWNPVKGGNRMAFILNGPSNDQQPTFEWGGNCNNKIPARTMKTFDYPWVQLTIPNEDEQ